MKLRKLHVDVPDLAGMFGISTRQAYRKYRDMLRIRKKKKSDLITTTDVAIAFHCDKAELDAYLAGNQ